MTKEEAIKVLEQIRQWTDYPKEALTMAIEDLSQPSLPSNLDEAAEEIASNIAPTHPDIGWDECFEKIKDAFKAGAEWMTGQGYTKEGIAHPDIYEIWVDFTDTDIRDGDEVIVQIRKK